MLKLLVSKIENLQNAKSIQVFMKTSSTFGNIQCFCSIYQKCIGLSPQVTTVNSWKFHVTDMSASSFLLIQLN